MLLYLHHVNKGTSRLVGKVARVLTARSVLYSLLQANVTGLVGSKV